MTRLSLTKISQRADTGLPLWVLRRQYRDGHNTLTYFASHGEARAAAKTNSRKVISYSILRTSDGQINLVAHQ